jgi:microcystin-dependent protein
MAILWNGSLIPWVNEPAREAYAGAKAYFFDAGTTTPQIVYTDAALSIPHDHPVVADGVLGTFPAVFLVAGGSYHLRITDADGVTLHDVDNISTPTTIVPDPPSGGTAAEFLYQTGDIKMAWRTSAPTGYVRANGRTIGQASSGATERANADCQALFLFLWTQDANLAVSGGRGGTAAGDWAAAKTIALPDFRGRIPLGMDTMGGAAANRVTDAQLGADSDLLGAAGGEAAHVLTTAELASHTHTGTTASNGLHGHPLRVRHTSTSSASGHGGVVFEGTATTDPAFTGTPSDTDGEALGGAGAHTHTITTDGAGSGTAHNNLQPSVVVPFFIKL